MKFSIYNSPTLSFCAIESLYLRTLIKQQMLHRKKLQAVHLRLCKPMV